MAQPVSILLFAFKKPELPPDQFKAYLEDKHIPLLQQLAGKHFPLTHTRWYISRPEDVTSSTTGRSDSEHNIATPATAAAAGKQDHINVDVINELVFRDEAHLHAFMGVMMEPVTAAEREKDEDEFLDRSVMKVVILGTGDVVVTKGPSQ